MSDEMKEIYVYNIGYTTYDDNSMLQFSHAKKFSDNELHNLVCTVLGKILYTLTKNRKKRKAFSDVPPTWQALELPNIMDLFNAGIRRNKKLHNLFTLELQKCGFSPLQFQATVDLFGWGSPLHKVWRKECDTQTKSALCKIKKTHLSLVKGK